MAGINGNDPKQVEKAAAPAKMSLKAKQSKAKKKRNRKSFLLVCAMRGEGVSLLVLSRRFAVEFLDCAASKPSAFSL